MSILITITSGSGNAVETLDYSTCRLVDMLYVHILFDVHNVRVNKCPIIGYKQV